ncbi:MAG: DUF4199 domain-containing protein [Bacteroidales bacterium]
MGEEQKIKTITQYAMEYGTYMGLFFIVKFFIMTYALRYSSANMLSTVMIIGIPVLAFYMIKWFRDKSGNVTFARIWLFGIYMFFFASLLSGVMEYVYYRYMNPDYIQMQQQAIADMLGQLSQQNNVPMFATIQKALSKSEIPAPIDMVFQGIWGTVFLGSMFSLLLAIFMRRKHKIDNVQNQ